MKRYLLYLIIIVINHCFVAPVFSAESGTFIGRVVTEWIPGDGRRMKLLEPFAYIDTLGVRWNAPAGWVVDGASIPKFAWSIIGGPYEGKYRNASVIHDVACDERKKPWQSVHRVFYEAMLVSGVEVSTAKIMYAAVYHFGPRWSVEIEKTTLPISEIDRYTESITPKISKSFDEELKITYRVIPRKGPACPTEVNCKLSGEIDLPPTNAELVVYLVPMKDKLSEEDFQRLKLSIEAKDLSLEQIENFE